MTKKDFILLADILRDLNPDKYLDKPSTEELYSTILESLAAFCYSQNPRFKRERWLAYIDGKCGPNGGKVKK